MYSARERVQSSRKSEIAETKQMDSAENCARQRMQSLADKPHTDVLEYVFDRPIKDATAQMCVKLSSMVIEERSRLPVSMPKKEARKIICEKDQNLATFKQTHPRIFSMMLDVEKNKVHLEMLKRMARVRQEIENNNMTEMEARVHVNKFVTEHSMRDPNEKERDIMKSNEQT